MHVVGKMKPSVAKQSRQELASARAGASAPLTFFKTRPVASSSEFGH
jgi:putative protease